MGRYAFFSTGVEYKFGFAVQESSDILAFGGYRSLRDPEQIAWIAEKDLDYIRKRLTGHDQPMLDMAKYEKNGEGYERYMQDIREALRTRLNIKESYGSDASQDEKENWETYFVWGIRFIFSFTGFPCSPRRSKGCEQ